ncbi:hypothetical protein Tco_1543939, partial [Tanacetum coccineum]
ATKTNYVRQSLRSKTEQASTPPSGKRVKATAKVAKSGKKKQPALRLEALSDVALTEAQQMKLNSNPQLTCQCNEEDDDDEANSGKDKDDDDQDDDDNVDHSDDDEQTEFDNEGDDFVHPKFTILDDEARHEEEVNEEDSFDPRVQTPSHVETTYDEDNDDETQEGHDVEMTDAQQTNVQTTQVIEDTYVIITLVNPEVQQQSSSVSSGFVSNMLNPTPEAGIDSLFNLNTESTSLIDVLVTTLAEPPLLFVTNLPPPSTHLITHLQQTPTPTPPIPSSSLQDLPNFSSLFSFDHRLKTLEDNFSEFMQTNQFTTTVSSIPGIVDQYLGNRMNDVVKTAVQL